MEPGSRPACVYMCMYECWPQILVCADMNLAASVAVVVKFGYTLESPEDF